MAVLAISIASLIAFWVSSRIRSVSFSFEKLTFRFRRFMANHLVPAHFSRTVAD
jgi:hypothetical protein